MRKMGEDAYSSSEFAIIVPIVIATVAIQWVGLVGRVRGGNGVIAIVSVHRSVLGSLKDLGQISRGIVGRPKVAFDC
jgi:hypothetical protein